MAKNIEININTTGNFYETLYPQTNANMVKGGTFTESYSFSTPPSCSMNPSNTNHLVRKAYVDSATSGLASQSWVSSQLAGLGGAKIQSGYVRGTGTLPSTGSVLYAIPISFSPYLFCFGEDGCYTPGLVNFKATANSPNVYCPQNQSIIAWGKDLTTSTGVDVNIRFYEKRNGNFGVTSSQLKVKKSGSQMQILYDNSVIGQDPKEAYQILNESGTYYYWVAVG